MKRHTGQRQQGLLRTAGLIAVVVALTSAMSAFGTGDTSRAATGYGTITGLVTDHQTRAPLANVCVFANGNNFETGVSTASNGTYAFNSLPAGQYRIGFGCIPSPGTNPQYVQQYFNNKPSYFSATIVTVSSGHTLTGVNAALDKVGHITGVVKAKTTGAALAGICVGVSDPSGGGAFTQTANDGSYSVTTAPGKNIVSFSDCQNEQYVSQYYLDQGQFQSATPVYVVPGGTRSGINASLIIGGTISGMVVQSSDRTPIQSIRVNVLPVAANGSLGAGFAITDDQGHYQALALAPGKYIVRFSDFFGNYAYQYYNKVTQPAASTTVTVLSGHDTGGINGSMVPAGVISGNLTDAVTGGLPKSQVCVYDRLNDVRTAASAFPNADGSYQLNALVPGNHKVEFASCSFSTSAYPTQFWNGKSNVQSATPIAIQSGSLVSGINAALGSNGLAGTCSDQYQVKVNSNGTVSGSTAQISVVDTPAHSGSGYELQWSDKANTGLVFSGATGQDIGSSGVLTWGGTGATGGVHDGTAGSFLLRAVICAHGPTPPTTTTVPNTTTTFPSTTTTFPSTTTSIATTTTTFATTTTTFATTTTVPTTSTT